MRYGLGFFYLALLVASIVGLERVASVQPEFLWRERATAATCPIYRSLYKHLSSYGSKVFFRSGTALWKDTAAASFDTITSDAPHVAYPAPSRFERWTGNSVAVSERKEDLAVDTSRYFGQVTAERRLFIRHCFDDGQASFFDGFGWLGFRELLFGSYDVREWNVTPVGISPDERYALVYAENHCGFLCGLGEFYLFERQGGEWVLAGTSLRFVS